MQPFAFTWTSPCTGEAFPLSLIPGPSCQCLNSNDSSHPDTVQTTAKMLQKLEQVLTWLLCGRESKEERALSRQMLKAQNPFPVHVHCICANGANAPCTDFEFFLDVEGAVAFTGKTLDEHELHALPNQGSRPS